MTTDNEHSGTLRTDYEADLARLDDFPALTADWRTLLHQLIRASRVSLTGGRSRYGASGSSYVCPLRFRWVTIAPGVLLTVGSCPCWKTTC